MKNIFWIAFFLFVIAGASQAQEITMYKTFGGVRFERDSTVLSIRQVMDVLHENPIAFAEFKKAKKNYNVASVLGFTGGVLVGIPLGTALIGGDPEWSLMIAGGVFILGSVPFNRIFKARALNALDIYNGKSASRVQTEFNFAGTSARLVIRF